MIKLTSRGYELEIMDDGTMYDRNKITLHTDREDLKELWFKKFDKLISLTKACDPDIAENTCCLKSLNWISNYFDTFQKQAVWVDNGIKFFQEQCEINSYRIE